MCPDCSTLGSRKQAASAAVTQSVPPTSFKCCHCWSGHKSGTRRLRERQSGLLKSQQKVDKGRVRTRVHSSVAKEPEPERTVVPLCMARLRLSYTRNVLWNQARWFCWHTNVLRQVGLTPPQPELEKGLPMDIWSLFHQAKDYNWFAAWGRRTGNSGRIVCAQETLLTGQRTLTWFMWIRQTIRSHHPSVRLKKPAIQEGRESILPQRDRNTN